MTADVVVDRVTKVFDDGTRAVDELDLTIEAGEFMVLVGPSGCGKTTALRMVAGLEDVTEGDIRIGGRSVTRVPAKDRDIAMVFQNYALYPHLTVAENIGFGLRLRKVPKAEIRRRVEAVAHQLGLHELLGRKPRALSGGQRQRVAMGRAIVREPKAFLMDEPLSNLDAKLRVQMRAEIARLQRDLEVTTIYVTHDQVEAMTMGDRVAVLKKGVLQQVDAPQVLYDHPVNLFVAGFVGSPPMNLLTGRIDRTADGAQVHLGSQSLALPPSVLRARPRLQEYDGRDLVVGIRPQDLHEPAGSQPDARLRGVTQLVEALGAEILVHFEMDAPPVVTEDTRELALDVGDIAAEELAREARTGASTCLASLPARSRLKVGDHVDLGVATDRLQFFDLTTGAAIAPEPRSDEP